MHVNCIGKKGKFYSVLTVIDAFLTKAFQTTYTPVPAITKTSNRFILHYLVISTAKPSNIATKPCNAYKLHWKSVKLLWRIDGHRRVIDQSFSKNIYSSTSTYQNTKPL